MQHLDGGGVVTGPNTGNAGGLVPAGTPGGIPGKIETGFSNLGRTIGRDIGQPGTSTANTSAFGNNPNSGYNAGSFQGGWNNASDPFSTGTMAADAANATHPTAPQIGAASTGNQPGAGAVNAAQAGQTGLEGLLGQEANGTLSLSTQQLQAGQQTNAANTMALEAGARGGNPAMAAINAGQTNAASNQQAAQTEAGAGIAEREGAANSLGNVLNQQGTLGLNEATTNAGLQQGAELANQQTTMQQQAQNNQMVQYYTSQGMSQEQAQLQANIAQQQILAGGYENAQGNAVNQGEFNGQQNGNTLGGIISAAGSIGAGIIGALAKGGEVPGYDAGGQIDGVPAAYTDPLAPSPSYTGITSAPSQPSVAQSALASQLATNASDPKTAAAPQSSGLTGFGAGLASLGKSMTAGQSSLGGASALSALLADGGEVPHPSMRADDIVLGNTYNSKIRTPDYPNAGYGNDAEAAVRHIHSLPPAEQANWKKLAALPPAAPVPMSASTGIAGRLQSEPGLAAALAHTANGGDDMTTAQFMQGLAQLGGNGTSTSTQPGFAGGGELRPLDPATVEKLRDHGGRIPGEDTGEDTVTDGRVGLRPGELVVNQESEEYPRAKRVLDREHGRGRRFAAQAASHAS